MRMPAAAAAAATGGSYSYRCDVRPAEQAKLVVGVAPADEHGDAAAHDVEPRPVLLDLPGQARAGATAPPRTLLHFSLALPHCLMLPLLHAAIDDGDRGGGGVAPAEHRGCGGGTFRRGRGRHRRRRLDVQVRRRRPPPAVPAPAHGRRAAAAAPRQLLRGRLLLAPLAAFLHRIQ